MTDPRRPFRERLPARRRSVTSTVVLRFRAPGDGAHAPASEHTFHVAVGFYPDGRPAEVFVKAAQHLDSAIAFLVEDVAVLVSNLIQLGMTLEKIQASIARPGDMAASIVAALIAHVAGVGVEPSMPLTSNIVNGALTLSPSHAAALKRELGSQL